MRVDAKLCESGPNPGCSKAMVKAGHCTDIALLKCSNDAREIVGINPHVAVSHYDDLMLDTSPHVDKIGNLVVQAVHRRIDDEIKMIGPTCSPKSLNNGNRLIPSILHADHDLNGARIVLTTEGSKVFKQAMLCAMQWLEDCYPWHRRAWRR